MLEGKQSNQNGFPREHTGGSGENRLGLGVRNRTLLSEEYQLADLLLANWWPERCIEEVSIGAKRLASIPLMIRDALPFICSKWPSCKSGCWLGVLTRRHDRCTIVAMKFKWFRQFPFTCHIPSMNLCSYWASGNHHLGGRRREQQKLERCCDLNWLTLPSDPT